MKTNEIKKKQTQRRVVDDYPANYFSKNGVSKSDDYYTKEDEFNETKADMEVVKNIISNNYKKGNGLLTGGFWK